MSSPKGPKPSLFDYDDYKAYLRDRLSISGEARGGRSRLAAALRCQSAFVSQVLNADSHFSAEHAVSISRFFEHTDEERHFFILLVQRSRAGVKELEEYYTAQIRDIRTRRQLIQERIQVKQGLTAEDQMTYYSAWQYAAIHILTAIPAFQRADSIARALQLPLASVKKYLDFLVSTGLVAQEGERCRNGDARIHLPRNSPMIQRHHVNWRLRAMHSLDHADPDDLHYSSVVAISREDAARIREKVLKLLETIEPVIQASPEEQLHCLALDWFGV